MPRFKRIIQRCQRRGSSTLLEQKEIYVSTGSACSSKKKGSHVLNAIGLTPDEIEGAIRFSLSDLNTKEEIMQTVEVLKESVSDLRMIIGRRRQFKQTKYKFQQ